MWCGVAEDEPEIQPSTRQHKRFFGVRESRSGSARRCRHVLGVVCLTALWLMPPALLVLGVIFFEPVYREYGLALPQLTMWPINAGSMLTGMLPGRTESLSNIHPQALMYVAGYLALAAIFIVSCAAMYGRTGRVFARIGAIPLILASVVLAAGWFFPLVKLLSEL